jgi:hypothetical protein
MSSLVFCMRLRTHCSVKFCAILDHQICQPTRPDLTSEAERHSLIDVGRQFQPDPADPLNLSRTSKNSLGPYLQGDPRNFSREDGQLSDHVVNLIQ